MSRRGRSIGAVAIVLAVAGTGLWRVWPNDSASRVRVSDAVLAFRQAMGREGRRTGRPEALAPPFGVYRYATRGRESIDTLFATGGHNYSGVSTITLTPARCGITERWVALAERSTERRLCLSSRGSRLTGLTEFHEFFERPQSIRYECEGGGLPPTPKLRPGIHRVTACGSASGTVRTDVRVVGLKSVTAAGRRVPAVQLRTSAVLRGNPAGTAQAEWWLRRSDGLVLERTSSSSAHIDAGGGGKYTEHYTLRLLSFRAQR